MILAAPAITGTPLSLLRAHRSRLKQPSMDLSGYTVADQPGDRTIGGPVKLGSSFAPLKANGVGTRKARNLPIFSGASDPVVGAASR